MTDITLSLTRLDRYRTGLGLSEDTTRRIIIEVIAEGLETEEDRLAEMRRRMFAAAMKGER